MCAEVRILEVVEALCGQIACKGMCLLQTPPALTMIAFARTTRSHGIAGRSTWTKGKSEALRTYKGPGWALGLLGLGALGKTDEVPAVTAIQKSM